MAWPEEPMNAVGDLGVWPGGKDKDILGNLGPDPKPIEAEGNISIDFHEVQ